MDNTTSSIQKDSLVHGVAKAVRLQQGLQRADGLPHGLVGRVLDCVRQDLRVHERQRCLQTLLRRLTKR